MQTEQYLSGKLLIAMPDMADPRFRKSVILMLFHSDKDAMGVVVNKIAGSICATQISDADEDPVDESLILPLHDGGPVDPERIMVIHAGGRFGVSLDAGHKRTFLHDLDPRHIRGPVAWQGAAGQSPGAQLFRVGRRAARK